jgi:hypothetical protein
MFKMWRWKAIELSRETEMDYTDEFDIARKAWPGIKRGLDTELKCLKKHKDWRKVIRLLKPAIDEQINRRKQKLSLGVFVPPWKNFKTWLNNRCWEEEEPAISNPSQTSVKNEIEKRKKRTRELAEDWLKSKTNEALLDLKKDKAARWEYGWLIDEIIEKRRKLMEK